MAAALCRNHDALPRNGSRDPHHPACSAREEASPSPSGLAGWLAGLLAAAAKAAPGQARGDALQLPTLAVFAAQAFQPALLPYERSR